MPIDQVPPEIQQPVYAELLKPASWAASITAFFGGVALVINRWTGRNKGRAAAEAEERRQDAADRQQVVENMQKTIDQLREDLRDEKRRNDLLSRVPPEHRGLPDQPMWDNPLDKR